MDPSDRPRCWCIGLGRTGTTSFCRALRVLGYQHVVNNPEFDQLRQLDGGADNGVAIFYKYLDYKFPGSKFVVTVRELESWLQSMEYIFAEKPVRSRADDVSIMRRMTIFETVAFDRVKFINAYQRHYADVRRYFAHRNSDLLEMRIVDGEGWQKLCPFLGLPIPQEAFPHLNARSVEQRRNVVAGGPAGHPSQKA